MTDNAKEFREKLSEVREISTLPHVMVRIMEIITDEKSSAADLAKEIAVDASLTAKILKMVNSAYYGFYREIVKISDAVVVLGFNEIRRLSLAISVLDMFGGNQPGHRLRHWNHSFMCAAMSDILAKEWHIPNKGAFTVGLLHDIGKLVLDQYFNSMFLTVRARMEELMEPAHVAEKSLYGFDHADIGYWLSERWNLPVDLSEAIRCHHCPEDAQEASDLVKVVFVADALCLELEGLKEAGLPVSEISDDGKIGLSQEEKAEFLSKLEQRIRNTSSVSSII
jgi:HD-like signal output (HDOD) protein